MIKILLADDEIEARDNIIQYIDWAANGLELVGAAGDGEEALQMIRRLKPDIAILDIYMPKLSGIQVIEHCRAELEQQPAFIIVSGYNDFTYAQQAIRLKVEEYLLKPFNYNPGYELTRLKTMLIQQLIKYHEHSAAVL